MSIKNQTSQEMEAAIDHLQHDLKSIRTGRANPGLVEGVTVEVYGAAMRLADIANITSPEARQLLVTPYDPSNTSAIAKAIEQANLSIQVTADANSVRLTVPPMDEATRKEMVKLCSRRCEEGKVSIRNVRRKYNDLVRKQKSEGEITEDIQVRNEKEIQSLTDDFCKKIDSIAASKEKEILTI